MVRSRWSPVVTQFSSTAATAITATAQHCSAQAGAMRASATGAVRQMACANASSHAPQKMYFSQSPRAGRSSGSRRLPISMASVATSMPVTVVTAKASTQRAPPRSCFACWRLRFSTKKTKPVAMHAQPERPPSTYSHLSSQWRKCCRCRPVRKVLTLATGVSGGSSRSTSPVEALKWMPSPVSAMRSVPARYTLT